MARQLLHLRHLLLPSPKTLLNLSDSLLLQTSSSYNSALNSISRISTRSVDPARSTISSLAKEILSSAKDASPDLSSVLESYCAKSMVRLFTNSSSFVQLLSLLKPQPLLALQVFDWRRKLPDSPSLTITEYASAIALAGRAHKLPLAVKLFDESISTTVNEPILYNALMTAHLHNGDISKTVSLFDKLKKGTKYGPDSVSYNILLRLYSLYTLVDKMESVLRVMDSSGVPRTVETYIVLIRGYLRCNRWDEMERAFASLKEPDVRARLLMLRGYAIAGELEKMERMYELVKVEVHTQERSLIWAMICAYCKIGGQHSIKKIEELVKFVREEEYFPYLHVLLINIYAQEGSIDEMERLVAEAFKRKIVVSSVRIIRKILAVYFTCGEADRLNFFIKQAEKAGWSLCKSLYRCIMILYSHQGRISEMRCIVDKMDSYWPNRDRRTLKILYRGFCNAGRRMEMDMVLGLMFKYGFRFPQDAVVK